jgi:hypothetical protein
MKFRVPDIVLGAFLTVAVFAMGMLFASSYQPGPSAKNQSQQSETAAKNSDASKPPVAEYSKEGQAAQHKEEKSEFWSAKLTDWLLAVFTLFLVAFTAALVRSTNRLWIASREDFIATHRPKVIVRFIQEPFYDDAMMRKAWVTVVNIGVNPAIIEEFGGDIAYRNSYGWLPPGIDASPRNITPVILVSGQRHLFTVSAKLPFSDADIAHSAFDDRSTCIVGSIKYGDGQGVVRETAFYRIYNEMEETFTVSENPEDEYQD